MLPSNTDLVNLCNDIYSPTVTIGQWDYLDLGIDDGVFWGLKKLPGYDVIVFRGSITLQDWINDIRAVPIPTKIGFVHHGFYSDMEKMWSEAKSIITQPVIVTGHSLGAARADILAGLMTLDGKPPVLRVVFGEPKPGLTDFGAFISKIPAFSFRNGDDKHHDYVTDVPLTFPPMQFVHPTPIVVVTERPTGDLFETHGVFAYHHVNLYVAAVTAFDNQPKKELAA